MGVGKRGNDLVARWSDKDIDDIFKTYEDATVTKIIEAFAYIGEQFVNAARRNGTYTDRTGNLRSSIGYVIVINGDVVRKHVATKSDATADVEALIESVRGLYRGIVLIGFAGMNYAAAVESVGGNHKYDVITSSVPTNERVKQLMEKVISRAA